MPTRLEMRSVLRIRLEDTGAGPLWDDLALDNAIAAAVLRYGIRVPREEVLLLVVPAGATSVALPGPPADLDPARVVRVLDERGDPVPRARPMPVGDGTTSPTGLTGMPGGLAQAWRVWDGSLRLERPARGGTWRVEYLAPRAIPPDDVTAIDLFPGDEEAVTELALGLLLRRRVLEDAKRGVTGNTAMSREVERAEATAWRLLDRRRVAQGGWLT